jgi:hypothetical protein
MKTVSKERDKNKKRLLQLIKKAHRRNRNVRPEVIEREVAEAVRAVRMSPPRDPRALAMASVSLMTCAISEPANSWESSAPERKEKPNRVVFHDGSRPAGPTTNTELLLPAYSPLRSASEDLLVVPL